VRDSAALYFTAEERARLTLLVVDPRRLDVGVVEAETPRGPMPHVQGSIPRDAVRVVDLAGLDAHSDQVTGTSIVLLGFVGMTLLDLVGPLDALSRIASMGFDPTSRCEVASLNEGTMWTGFGLTCVATRHRPPLDAFDVLIVPGGPATRALENDAALAAYLRTFPPNRICASVCTGALLLGAAGRLQGKRATTHHAWTSRLADYGATATARRVVDEGQLVTAGGVTAGIDLGLHLVRRLAGDDVHRAVARQMEFT
jgi:cyclohexyl-isocyanide hydratase